MFIYIEKLVIYTDKINNTTQDADTILKPFIANHCKVAEDDIIDYKIIQRSMDNRKKPKLALIFKVEVELKETADITESLNFVEGKAPKKEHKLNDLKTQSDLPENPIIVGTGPAGIMAAYLLAQYGCKPIIIDRGYNVEKRCHDIAEFEDTRKLNTESNYLNGEGGAGTYSDGKLYTRVKNPRTNYVLDAFIKAGAPEEISYLSHPHIGSDKLIPMMSKIREQIEAWGGKFMWGTKVDDIVKENGKCTGVLLSTGEKLEAEHIILALGHSARSMIKTLVNHDVDHKLKGFQIGSRIEHPQIFINRMRYGLRDTPPFLKSAEYNLISRPKPETEIANVTSFCMCPGGEIVAATSHEGQLSTNGMSRYARNEEYSNAALIVNQDISNFSNAQEAFDFIEKIEKKAFKAGGEDYTAPAQSALGFVNKERHMHRDETSYQFGLKEARIDYLFPKRTVRALTEALTHFEKIAPGFIGCGMFVGAETRISSPVRFIRDPEMLSSSLQNLYIAGEGAGNASGIISAALDGMKIAEVLITGKPYEK